MTAKLLRAKLFSSLKADLRPDIRRGFVFRRCINWTFPWMKYSVQGFLINQLRRDDFYLLLFSFGLMHQFLIGTIPSRKCSPQAAAVLDEEILLMSWRRSTITEVNDLALDIYLLFCRFKILCQMSSNHEPSVK